MVNNCCDMYAKNLVQHKLSQLITINGERLTGLNFHGFQEHCESFSVSISTSLKQQVLLAKEKVFSQKLQ